MGNNKTVEERVGILEALNKDIMSRVERLENKLIGALGIGVILVLGMVANIIVSLIKK